MPAPIRIMATLPTMDGVPKNSVKMDFCFADDVFDVMAAVITFFNGPITGATHPPAYYLSTFLNRAANMATLQKYSLAAPIAGSGVSGPPILTTPFTLGGPGGVGLPQEVCCCVSYHAVDASIPEHAPGARPKARYRGRVYFGPLQTIVLDTDPTSKRSRLAAAFTLDMTRAATKLLADQPSWGVYSRKDRIVRPIVGGWVDDDYDIQRRRGTDPVARTNWGA
jgi:hypothetical protein